MTPILLKLRTPSSFCIISTIVQKRVKTFSQISVFFLKTCMHVFSQNKYTWLCVTYFTLFEADLTYKNVFCFFKCFYQISIVMFMDTLQFIVRICLVSPWAKFHQWYLSQQITQESRDHVLDLDQQKARLPFKSPNPKGLESRGTIKCL